MGDCGALRGQRGCEDNIARGRAGRGVGGAVRTRVSEGAASRMIRPRHVIGGGVLHHGDGDRAGIVHNGTGRAAHGGRAAARPGSRRGELHADLVVPALDRPADQASISHGSGLDAEVLAEIRRRRRVSEGFRAVNHNGVSA